MLLMRLNVEHRAHHKTLVSVSAGVRDQKQMEDTAEDLYLHTLEP